MARTAVFVTGANRGLGFGLVKHFVANSNYVIFTSFKQFSSGTDRASTRRLLLLRSVIPHIRPLRNYTSYPRAKAAALSW